MAEGHFAELVYLGPGLLWPWLVQQVIWAAGRGLVLCRLASHSCWWWSQQFLRAISNNMTSAALNFEQAYQQHY